MNPIETLRFAWRNIRNRKVRSWLTILGIIIGVATIVSLYTLGEGLENAITDQFSRFGPRRIMIGPEGLTGPPLEAQGLTQKDVDALEKVKEVEHVSGLLWIRGDVVYNRQRISLGIRGIKQDTASVHLKDMGLELEEGQHLDDAGRFTAVVGYKFAHETFGKHIFVRNKIQIEGRDFVVVGIMKDQGNQEFDRAVIIPMEAARIVFDKPEEVSAIAAIAKEGLDLDRAVAAIERKLERVRGDDDFAVITPVQIQEQINQILGVVKFVLIGIAAISLVVGGIGIMNVMFTSVLERTREIGVMKAVGGRNQDVLSLFLVEAGLFGLVGGCVGLALGFGLAYTVQFMSNLAGFSFLAVRVNPELFVFGLGFALVVGLVSGIIPAVNAAHQKPVDSLRYE